MNQEFKNQQGDYLLEVSDDLVKIEGIILDLESHKCSAESFALLRRILHTIKGSAPSYQFQPLSILAHQMEDSLALLSAPQDADAILVSELLAQKDQLEKLVKAFLNSDLEYLEKWSAKNYAEERSQGTKIHKDKGIEAPKKVLFIEPTKSIARFAGQILKQKNISLSPCEDGYVALGRLLHEPFDLVVSGIKLNSIEGDVLLKVCKMIKGPNVKTPFMFVTSSEAHPSGIEDSKIINKNLGIETMVNGILSHFGIAAADPSKSKNVDIPFTKILIVDDAIEIFKLASLSLKKVSPRLSLKHCADPRMALNEVALFGPDLVLIDVEMPHMNGKEVFSLMKKMFPKIPVASLTATDSKKGLDELLALQPHGVLKKPLDLAEFPQEISKLRSGS